MSTAHAEAVAMAVCAALFLTISALAMRLRIKKGIHNQWLYIAPIGVAIALVIMVLNLNGVVIAGG